LDEAVCSPVAELPAGKGTKGAGAPLIDAFLLVFIAAASSVAPELHAT
jgi:hypothetical protein